MNKAIYIFDEPKGCVNCPFYKWEESESLLCFNGEAIPCYISICTLLRKEVLPIENEYESTKDPNCPLMIFRGSTAGVRKMTLIEALHDIQRLKIHSAKTAVDAIKKAIPQEFKNDSKPGTYMCPKCETPVKKTDLYCRHCGQALKEREKSYD